MAEVLPNGDSRVLMQLHQQKDLLEIVNRPLALMETLNLYAGLSKDEVYYDLKSKIAILQWLVKRNITDVHKIGLVMSKYYKNKNLRELRGV